MPRATVLDSSPLPVVGPSGLPPPTQPKRTQKRSVDETLLLTPPGTIKRERKRHNTPPASSRKGKTRNSSRGRASTTTRPGTRSAHETDSEAEVETELESLGGSDKVFGSSVACKLDFGRSAKRRRLGELDARLETLLELDGENAENPFWDGPSKKDNSKEDKEKASTEETKEGARDKHVRLRSPTPPLLNFRGKPPVSPPPSNRRKKGTRKSKKAAAVTETIIEEPSESSKEVVIEEPSKEVTAEPSKEVPGELSKEEVSEETTTEEVSKEATEEVVEEPQIELPSTPKGKARSLPIRDSPNNPFLDDGASPSSAIDQLPEPRTPTAVAEKPTITYVFRGVRAQFANPMYNLPPEVHERALLPPSHPDFSPDPTCPPKLLFPKAKGRASSRRSVSPTPCTPRRTRNSKQRAVGSKDTAIPPALSHSDREHQWDSDDDEPLRVTPPKKIVTRSSS